MTIINRRTYTLKPGKVDEAVKILLETREAWPEYTGPFRVYSPWFGPQDDVVAVEFEYEDLADMETQWAAFFATPLNQEFMARMGPLEVASHHNEIRRLVAATTADGAGNAIAFRNVLFGQSQNPKLVQSQVGEFVTPNEGVVRISVPETGWWGEVTTEFEFEDFSDYEAKVAEWWARPATAAYFEAINPMVSPGGRTELWHTHH